MTPAPKKLLDRVREAIRLKHYSIRTEQAYVDWIRRFILFHDKRHPEKMGADEIEAFLTHLAVEKNVAASTQNQALSALLFLYRNVLKQDIDFPTDVVRAKKPKRLPTVPLPWQRSTPTLPASGSGSTSFRPIVSPWTRARTPSAATTQMKAACKGPAEGSEAEG